MQTINIALCEDDANDAHTLRRIVAASGISADTHVYENTEQFLSSFRAHMFQLVFLDIYFEGSADGIDTALKIRELDPDVWIAFTTSSPDFATFGYKVHAQQYLTKPLDEEEVLLLLSRAADYFDKMSDEIFVTIERKKRGIRQSEIRYVEVFNKKCMIHLASETIETYLSLEDMERQLTLPSFLRCHRSYIVNMDYIQGDDGRDFIMQGGEKVYIGHLIQWKTRKAYQEYLVRLARAGRADEC